MRVRPSCLGTQAGEKPSVHGGAAQLASHPTAAPPPHCPRPAAVKCERVRASLGQTRARGEVDLEVNVRKMQHKEDKMQRERLAGTGSLVVDASGRE